MSTTNRELQEMQGLLRRVTEIPEQPEGAVMTEELRQFKELLERVPESKEPSRRTFFEICAVSDRELSYSSFLESFLNPLGEHGFGDLFLKSLVRLLDFITSIDHLEKGTYMDKTLLKFFQENERRSLRLHQKTQELIDMMREKVKKVGDEVQFPSRFAKRYVKISERLTCIAEANFFLNRGWMIVVFPEDRQSFADLGKWLKDSGLKLTEKSPFSTNDKRWVYAEFPFQENEEVVAGKYQELLSKIADKLKNKSTR
jgi:hypothetical protein